MTEGEEFSARGIAEKIAADARMRLVCMKPEYDTIDLGEALITRFAEQARTPTAAPSDEVVERVAVAIERADRDKVPDGYADGVSDHEEVGD